MTKAIGRQRDSSEQIVIRTGRTRYFFWGVVGLAIVLASSRADKSPSFWFGFALFLLAWSTLFLRLATYKITIDQDVLSYSALLQGVVSVRRDDIVSAEVLSGRFEHALLRKQGELDGSAQG